MSIIEPKAVTLRDGEMLTLRTPQVDEAPVLLAYLDCVRRQTPCILFSPEDELPDLEQEKQFIKARRESKHGAFIGAWADDELVALCDWSIGRHYRVQHRGDVAISVVESYHNRGLGTLLMRELVNHALDDPQVEVLHLTVFADNSRAIAVYRKLGFEIDGCKRWNVKREDGFVDVYTMTSWVGKGEPPGTDARSPGCFNRMNTLETRMVVPTTQKDEPTP